MGSVEKRGNEEPAVAARPPLKCILFSVTSADVDDDMFGKYLIDLYERFQAARLISQA